MTRFYRHTQVRECFKEQAGQGSNSSCWPVSVSVLKKTLSYWVHLGHGEVSTVVTPVVESSTPTSSKLTGFSL